MSALEVTLLAVHLNLKYAPTTHARRSPARVAVSMGSSNEHFFQKCLSVVTDTPTSLNIRIRNGSDYATRSRKPNYRPRGRTSAKKNANLE
jgi:hypothetical protein